MMVGGAVDVTTISGRSAPIRGRSSTGCPNRLIARTSSSWTASCLWVAKVRGTAASDMLHGFGVSPTLAEGFVLEFRARLEANWQ